MPEKKTITTSDGKEYGECKECGKSGRVYRCFYCDDGPFCWDCLQEHKEIDHNMNI